MVLFLPGIVSCTSNPAKNKQNVVTVTILPQEYFVRKIAGDKFRVNVLIPEEANHETYEPTARQMVNTGNSTAYFALGHMPVETRFLERLHETNPDLQVFDTSEGIQLLAGDDSRHGEHHHAHAVDPHIWLSVSAVRIQASNILKGLIRVDAADSAIFRENYMLFQKELDSTDHRIRQLLALSETRCFMIYHPSLAYFARDYDLEQIAVEPGGKEPGPAYMKQLIDRARGLNIRAILVSSQFSSQSAEPIARQLNARLESFNPSSPDWSDTMIEIAEKIAGVSRKNQ